MNHATFTHPQAPKAAGGAIGEGDVDIKGCLAVLAEAGYDGCVSIECTGVEALKRSIQYLRTVL